MRKNKNKSSSKENLQNEKKNEKGNGHSLQNSSMATAKKKYLILAILVVYTFLIFSKTITNQFVNWDDPFYLFENRAIQDFSLNGFKNIFTTPVIGMYNPMTFVVYAIEYKIWGFNPVPYHLFNLVFHLLNTVIIFNFIYLLTKRLEAATIVALLFAIHPMHVGAVAWVCQTKTLLFFMFYMLALINYIKYIGSNYQTKYLIYTVLLFILSVLSKPSAVTLILVLFLLDYYLSRKIDKRLLLEKLPFIILSLFFGLLTLYTHSEAGDSIFEKPQEYSFINKILLMNHSVVFYLNKLVYPNNLSAIYPYPDNTSWLPFKYIRSIPVIPLVLWLVYKAGNFRKELVFGLLFFIFSISVVLRFMPSGFFSAANRYSYMSYTGFFFIVAQFYCWIIDNKFSFAKKIKPYIIIALCIYSVIFSVITVKRVKVWENSITLFDDILKKFPNIVLAYNNRAVAKKDIGDNKGAIEDFGKSIELDSTYAPAYNNRGEIKRLTGDNEGAMEDYNKALSINPKYVEAYNNRGIIKLNATKFEEAIVDFNMAIILNPKNGASYHNRGIARLYMKDTVSAHKDWFIAKKLGIKASNDLLRMTATTTINTVGM